MRCAAHSHSPPAPLADAGLRVSRSSAQAPHAQVVQDDRNSRLLDGNAEMNPLREREVRHLSFGAVTSLTVAQNQPPVGLASWNTCGHNRMDGAKIITQG